MHDHLGGPQAGQPVPEGGQLAKILGQPRFAAEAPGNDPSRLVERARQVAVRARRAVLQPGQPPPGRVQIRPHRGRPPVCRQLW